MAKLSARGRTELHRVSKTNGTTVRKLALMSDNTVLQCYTFVEYDGRSRRNTGWGVVGKLRKEIKPETWLENKLNDGWVKITR